MHLTLTNKHATKFIKIKKCDALLEWFYNDSKFTLQEFCLQVQNQGNFGALQQQLLGDE